MITVSFHLLCPEQSLVHPRLQLQTQQFLCLLQWQWNLMTLLYVQNSEYLQFLLWFQMCLTPLPTQKGTEQQNREDLRVLLQHLVQGLLSDEVGDLDVLDLMNVSERHQTEAELLLNPSQSVANPTWASDDTPGITAAMYIKVSRNE